MKKIIAKEVNPAHVDFRYYFDDDGLKSVGGENCAVYIVPADRRRNSGFNMDEYREIEEKAEAIIDGFHDVSDKWTNGYDSYANYKEAMEYNDIPYTSLTSKGNRTPKYIYVGFSNSGIELYDMTKKGCISKIERDNRLFIA